MTARWTSWLAISLWTISVIFTVCALILMRANGGPIKNLELAQIGIFVGAILSSSTVGALVATHRPRNPLGWIFLLAGISLNMFPPADEYARYITETSPGNLPEPTLLFWLAAWVWIPALFVPATFGILLFPTGRLPSPRWRPFAWVIGLLLSTVVAAEMFAPGPLLEPPGAYPQFTNPIGIESLGGLLGTTLKYGEIALFGLLAGSVASIFVRLRTATDIERQQLKWFAYAAIVPIIGFSVFLILLTSSIVDSDTANEVGGLLIAFGVATLPIAIGIAILRHNLYDIDRLINRTLVYASLTALLVLGFAGNVLFLQFILAPFTGGNDLSVAGSTLLVFALFRPLRDRLQRFVDRRFYRQKYDIQLTLQEFGVAARDAVDLNQLTAELTSTVFKTMQPDHISVWLTPATARTNQR